MSTRETLAAGVLGVAALVACVVCAPSARSSGAGAGGTAGRGTGGSVSGSSAGSGGSAGRGGGDGSASSGGSSAGGSSNGGGSGSGSGSDSDTGGGSGAAGSTGVVVDAAVDSPLPDTCAGLFCEDFESGQIDPNIWNVKTSGGQTVVVQRANVAHGAYAAQFHANPNVLSYDLIITRNAPAGLRGHHFGRAYFYVAPRPPDAHTEFLFAGSAGFPKLRYLEVAGIHAAWQLTSVNLAGIDANAASVTGTTEAYSSGGTMLLAQWFCLEWELNDAPDQIRVFVNGAQDFAFTNIVLGGVSTGQVGAGGFTDFGFGYYAWHPATYPFDVYYDDIVLDTKRVGCLP